MSDTSVSPPSPEQPSKTEGPSIAQTGKMGSVKVSTSNNFTTSINEIKEKVVEIFRQILLAPAKDTALALLRATRERGGEWMNQRLTSLENMLGGKKVTLYTSNNLSILGMYFSASAPRKIGTKDRFTHGCEPTEGHTVKQPAENGPTVLFFSGVDISVFAESYETTIQAYLERGINVMVADYPGVGKSEGFFSVQNSYNAAEAAYQYVNQTMKVPPEKILAEGFSLGSGPASHLAAMHPGVNLLLRNPFPKMSEIAREGIREEFPNPFMKHVVAPAVQKISQVALPYDNEKWISQVQGPFGLLTGGPTDMFNEQLRTRERLSTAYQQSKFANQQNFTDLPRADDDELRNHLWEEYKDIPEVIENIDLLKARASQEKTNETRTACLKTAQKLEEENAQKIWWYNNLRNGRPLDQCCSIHMLTYAESPELAGRLDTFLEKIGFFS